MNIIKTFLFILFATISLCTCKKNSVDCPEITGITITGGGTVTQGWDIYLSFTAANPNFKYVVYGPNGWSMEFTERQVIRRNLQLQDAGTYTIRAYNDQNCVVFEGSTTVNVTAVQDAPCQGTQLNNSCTTDFPGLSSFNYSSINFTQDIANNRSTVSGLTALPIPANTYLAFMFGGTSKPKPGKYKTRFAYNAPGVGDEVVVHFNDGTTNKLYLSTDGQDVYVTLVNGKTQICFCNLSVSYTPLGIPYHLSGKITID